MYLGVSVPVLPLEPMWLHSQQLGIVQRPYYSMNVVHHCCWRRFIFIIYVCFLLSSTNCILPREGKEDLGKSTGFPLCDGRAIVGGQIRTLLLLAYPVPPGADGKEQRLSLHLDYWPWLVSSFSVLEQAT